MPLNSSVREGVPEEISADMQTTKQASAALHARSGVPESTFNRQRSDSAAMDLPTRLPPLPRFV
ncbi:hypothetical protein AB0M97_29260 [Streptomyces sp. NPDC051207]|uniref:hypothetical protein n=1 Tax=Streptomyces sp. NPDC051207 TaxID=3154641 RepID=UPI00343C1D1A